MQVPGPITVVKKEDGAPDLRTLAGRVRWAREQRKFSQAELATRSHVSQGTIGNIESGARKKPRDLLAIARGLYCSAEWLESGKGEWDTARAKGAVFEDPDQAEREMLYNWRRMMDDDRAELANEIAKRADRFQANMEKVMRERGLEYAMPRQASAAAKSVIAKASVQPSPQRQLPLETTGRRRG